MADKCIPLRTLAPKIEAALAAAPEGYAFRLGSGGVEVTPPSREAVYVYTNSTHGSYTWRSHELARDYAASLLDASLLRREGTATEPMLAALARHA
jgi:hypothetical protein